jgi:O-antigen ligase
MAAPLVFLGRKGLRSAIGTFCVIYVVVALAAPFFVERIYHYVDGSKIATLPHVSCYMARLELWKDLAPEIKSSLWLGHGADMTRAKSVTFGPMKHYDLPDIPSAHNMIFDIWYELGLMGIIALLLIISIAVRKAMQLQAGSLLVTTIMLLGTIVELSVDHRIWLSWVQGALILTIAASILASLQIEPSGSTKENASTMPPTSAR